MNYVVGFVKNESLANLIFQRIAIGIMNKFAIYDYMDTHLSCIYCGDAHFMMPEFLDQKTIEEDSGIRATLADLFLLQTVEHVKYVSVNEDVGIQATLADLFLLRKDEDTFDIMLFATNYKEHFVVSIGNAVDQEDIDVGVSFDIRSKFYDTEMHEIDGEVVSGETIEIMNIINECVEEITSNMDGSRVTPRFNDADD